MQRDLAAVIEDLNLVKGSIGQLQATVAQIVKRTPNLVEFQSILSNANMTDKFLEERLRHLINAPQLQVCIKFKHLYENDELPFLKMLGMINFRNLQADQQTQVLSYIMEYQRDSEESKKTVALADVLNEYESNSDGVYTDEIKLPDLLPINDDNIFKKIFIDKSFLDPIIEIQNIENYNQIFNSKLVIKGRLYLKTVLVEILDYKFPNLYYQDLEIITERLTSSTILFKLTLVYNLLDNFKFKFLRQFDTNEKITIIGNLFLSYLGGLTYKVSNINLKLWLYEIFKNFLGKVDTDATHIDDIIQREFKFLLGSHDYKFAELDNDPFVVKLHINENSVIGTSSKSVEHAKMNAIKELMNNRAVKQTILGAHIQESNRFKEWLIQNHLKADYTTSKIKQGFQCVIAHDMTVVGIGIDKVESLAVRKAEANALDNMPVLGSEQAPQPEKKSSGISY